MPSPYDLITTGYAASSLAAGGAVPSAAQTAILPELVTAASVEIQKELHRVIPAADYDEILAPVPGRPDRGEPSTVRLSRYPVNGSPLVWGGRATAVTVLNTDTATNQVAYAGFDAAGDPELQVTYTGLTLTRIASGVTTVNDIPFAGLTVRGLTDAVNAAGGGWTATVASGTPAPGLFPASMLAGAREPKPGFPPGCDLSLFPALVPGASVDRAAGIVSFNEGPYWGPGNGTGYGDWGGEGGYDGGGSRCGQVRVTYNAGYAAVPAQFQSFAAEVVKAMLERLRTDTTLASETAKDYGYTARLVLSETALQTVLLALQKYKDFSL